MEIRRFGIGHRQPDESPGTHGVEGRGIHSDERGHIAELAMRPNAAVVPHTNPNLTYFVVIEGGGFVRVGDETARISAGEAVVWPPHVVHAAWTELTPMRAIVVEFASPDEGRFIEAQAADGALEPAPPPSGPAVRREPADEEPW